MYLYVIFENTEKEFHELLDTKAIFVNMNEYLDADPDHLSGTDRDIEKGKNKQKGPNLERIRHKTVSELLRERGE